jgi:hypothetical protein
VEEDGLMSYGPNLAEEYSIAADYVGLILGNPPKQPAGIPLYQPTKVELVINRNTVAALGLVVPPTLAARADMFLVASMARSRSLVLRDELRHAAERVGWKVARIYKDHGISGAKDRNGRPAFDALCRDASKRQFDVVMARNVDRLGRSLKDLVAFPSEANTFASRSLDLPSVNSLSHARVRQLLFGHLDRVRMQIASGGTVLAATPRAARQ